MLEQIMHLSSWLDQFVLYVNSLCRNASCKVELFKMHNIEFVVSLICMKFITVKENCFILKTIFFCPLGVLGNMLLQIWALISSA